MLFPTENSTASNYDNVTSQDTNNTIIPVEITTPVNGSVNITSDDNSTSLEPKQNTSDNFNLLHKNTAKRTIVKKFILCATLTLAICWS